jgi:hypothetical protein
LVSVSVAQTRAVLQATRRSPCGTTGVL